MTKSWHLYCEYLVKSHIQAEGFRILFKLTIVWLWDPRRMFSQGQTLDHKPDQDKARTQDEWTYDRLATDSSSITSSIHAFNSVVCWASDDLLTQFICCGLAAVIFNSGSHMNFYFLFFCRETDLSGFPLTADVCAGGNVTLVTL